MKCVRIVGQGIPTRMSDDDAFCIVYLMGDGEYCPKRIWRKHVAHMRTLPEHSAYVGYSHLTEGDRKWMRDKGLRP